MSTAYRFEPTVSNADFLAAAAALGYNPIPCANTTDKQYLIGNDTKTEGPSDTVRAHLAQVMPGFVNSPPACWAYINDDGTVAFERFGLGNGDFLYEVAEAMGVQCLSEHDDGYYTHEDGLCDYCGEACAEDKLLCDECLEDQS